MPKIKHEQEREDENELERDDASVVSCGWCDVGAWRSPVEEEGEVALPLETTIR